MRNPSTTLDFFLGELLLAPFGVLPDGFLPCDGRQLSIDENLALFSLLGTTYGGNGQTTFALPDLRGRVPVGAGGFNPVYPLGEKSGTPTVTLLSSNAPAHTHNVAATSAASIDTIPAGNFYAASPAHYQSTPNTYMAAAVVSVAGGNQAHPNMMPSIALNWLIAVEGIYPSRPASFPSNNPEGER